jgi:hypothetical protein
MEDFEKMMVSIVVLAVTMLMAAFVAVFPSTGGSVVFFLWMVAGSIFMAVAFTDK